MSGKTFTVHAPLTGTFYRRPSPDDPPYVEEGDEIRCEKGGIIRRILIEDEDPVMINQLMFEIEI